jgi:hypothetical protein
MDGERICFAGPGGETTPEAQASTDERVVEEPHRGGIALGRMDSSTVAVGRQAKAVTVDDEDDLDEEMESLPTRRPVSAPRPAWRPGGVEDRPNTRHGGGMVRSPSTVPPERSVLESRRPVGPSTSLPTDRPHRASDHEGPAVLPHRVSGHEGPAVLHQQSWDIGGGNLTLEIRSSRSLPAAAFMQIGKIMAEVEKLRNLLTHGSESGEPEE